MILGCGNVLFGDDGFGPAVAEYLQSNHLVPDDVCVADAGTGVRKLLFTIALSDVRPKSIVIVDAFDAGREPGELFDIDPSQIPHPKLDDFSLHQLPTSNLLHELQQECGVAVRVLACQTGPLPTEIAPGLSPPVADAVHRATERLVRDYMR